MLRGSREMGFSIVILLLLVLSVLIWAGSPKGPAKPPSSKALTRQARHEEIIADGPDSQYHMGMACLEKSADKEGFDWLLASAEGGDAAAQDAIGLMYELGRGVGRNESEAAGWYEKSAEQGFPDGEVNFGYLLTLGKGVKRDYGKAAELFRRAAEEGYLEGKNSLAWLLATCPDDAFRDGQRAVEILEPVVAGGRRDPVLLDTLAAAYAETGAFSWALDLASEALTKTNRASEPILYGQVSLRLRYYESFMPWREPLDGAPEPPEALADGADLDTALHLEPGDARQARDSHAPAEGAMDRPKGADAHGSGRAAVLEEEGHERPAEGERPTEGPSQSHLDYIVEKLLVVENLLRPLAADSAAHGAQDDAASLEHREASDFSRSLVDAMIGDDYRGVYARMEKAFRAAVPEGQIGPMLDEMYATYGGHPLAAELKAEETGYRLYAGERKRVHKFWYSLRTSEQEKGVHSLFVEVYPEEGRLACSTFFIVPPGAGPK